MTAENAGSGNVILTTDAVLFMIVTVWRELGMAPNSKQISLLHIFSYVSFSELCFKRFPKMYSEDYLEPG